MKIREIIGYASLSLLLSGCSPHPGAGNWVADESNTVGTNIGFVELNVTYEGRTDIFDRKSDEALGAGRTAVRRCFWRGVNVNTIELTCVHADDSDKEESYQLRVAPDNKVAELMQNGRVMGRYVRMNVSK